uniref:Ectonucleotide pyrophosphatase/phosphodiesterase 7 n=1 Tax=Canis lupus familiaris TaxID=9615 RepID=A0A8P0P3Y8_CANLF
SSAVAAILFWKATSLSSGSPRPAPRPSPGPRPSSASPPSRSPAVLHLHVAPTWKASLPTLQPGPTCPVGLRAAFLVPPPATPCKCCPLPAHLPPLGRSCPVLPWSWRPAAWGRGGRPPPRRRPAPAVPWPTTWRPRPHPPTLVLGARAVHLSRVAAAVPSSQGVSAGTTPDALVSGRPIMGRLAVLLALALAALLAPGAGAPVGRKGTRNKLLLVSFDGFRWNYDQDVHTPNLDAMALDGVKARYMTPAFVTMTSPCHFTLVTGEHGPRGGAWGRERVEQPKEGNPPPRLHRALSPRGPQGQR